MAGVGHFYMTAHGGWATGTWAGETAQIGCRVVFHPALWGGNSPIKPLRDGGPVDQTFVDRETTLCTVSQTFDWNIPVSTRPWDDTCDDMVDDFHAFLSVCAGHQATGFKWHSIKVAPIEYGTGKYLAPASTYTFKSTINPSGANPLPPEVALAASLRAPIVGKRGRGRMYIPALTTGGLDGSGKASSTIRNNLGTGLATFVGDIRNLPNVDQGISDVFIMSGDSTSGVSPSEVRVGDHFDVQRRRQQQVDEIYTIKPV